jgi:hypothetical protein
VGIRSRLCWRAKLLAFPSFEGWLVLTQDLPSKRRIPPITRNRAPRGKQIIADSSATNPIGLDGPQDPQLAVVMPNKQNTPAPSRISPVRSSLDMEAL